MRNKRNILITILAGFIIFGTAFTFRTHGLDWDSGFHQHPDERFMTMVAAAVKIPGSITSYLNTSQSPANPYNCEFNSYVYGTFPLLLTRLIAEWTGQTSYDNIYITGRILSAFMDSLTALLIIMLARLWLRTGFALLAGLLYALCVFPVQQAHFFTADSTATAMSTLCLFLLCRMATGKGIVNGIGAGFIFGLALASRINLLLFLPLIPAAFVFMYCNRTSSKNWVDDTAFSSRSDPAGRTFCKDSAWAAPQDRPCQMLYLATGFLASLVMAAIAFRLFQPYAFDHGIHLSPQWLADIKNVMRISSGEFDVPYTRQWAERIPWLFPGINMIRFGMGWTLGLAAWTGALLFLFGLARHLLRDSANKDIIQAQATGILCLGWVLIVFIYHGHTFLMTMRYFLPIYPPLIVFSAWLMQQMCDSISNSRLKHLRRIKFLPPILLTVATLLWALAFSHIYRVPNSRIAASQWIIDNIPKNSGLAIEHWDDALPLPLPNAVNRYRHISLPLYDNDTPAKLKRLVNLLNKSDFIILASNRLFDSIPRLPRRYPMTIRYYDALFSGTLGFKKAADISVAPSLAGCTIDDQCAEEAFTVYDHPRVLIFQKTTNWNIQTATTLLNKDIDWHNISTRSARDSRKTSNRTPALSTAASRSLKKGRNWLKGASSASGLYNPHTFPNRHPLIIWAILLAALQAIAFPPVFLLFSKLPDRGWLTARFIAVLLLTVIIWLTGRLHLFPITPVSVRSLLAACTVLSLIILLRHRQHIKTFIRSHWRIVVAEECFFWLLFFLFLIIRAGNPDLWHPYFGGEKPMDFAFLNAAVRSVFYPPYNPWFSGEYINYYYMGFVLCSIWIKATGMMPAIAYNLIIPTLAAVTGGLAFTAGALLSRAFLPNRSGTHRIYPAIGIITALLTLLTGNTKQWLLLFNEYVPRWDWYWYASRAITTPAGDIPPITEFPYFTFLYGDLHAHMIGFPFLLFTLVLCTAIIHRRRTTPGFFILLSINTAMSYTVNAWDYPLQIACAAFAFLLSGYKKNLCRHITKSASLTLAAVIIGRLITLPFHLDFISGYNRFIPWNGPRTPWTDWLMIHGLFILPILISLPLLTQTLRRLKTNSLFYYWLILLTGALAIIIGVEFIVLDGDIGRMNTVFKFYLQAWFILALCAGSLFTLTLTQLRTRPKTAIPALVLILLCWSAGLLYPLTATPARWKDRFVPEQSFGLNGQTFLENAHYQWESHNYPLRDDFLAMQWLIDHATGTPVIIEAHLPEYRWGARYSIHTGLPTPIGWAWHQKQQHAGISYETVQPRTDDILNFYSSTSPEIARRIAEKYNVRYFIIGPAERAAYAKNGLEKFNRPSPCWTPVYTNRHVTVFETGY